MIETEIVEEIVMPPPALLALERRNAAAAALAAATRELTETTREALREIIVNADVSYRDASELLGLSPSRLSKLIGKMRLKGKALWLRSVRHSQLDFLGYGGLKPRVRRPSEFGLWEDRKPRRKKGNS